MQMRMSKFMRISTDADPELRYTSSQEEGKNNNDLGQVQASGSADQATGECEILEDLHSVH